MKKFYPGAPESSDAKMVNQLFCHYCNCYSYAVQDYFAGLLTGLSGSDRIPEDGGYLPRPGQTRGKTYWDIKGKNIRGMQRAVCEDGLLFAGKTYPKKVPDDKYVICCFLEPDQYHFIRQNQDGSWSSKNGLNEVSFLDVDDQPLTNPENYYHKDPDYPFVGYFLVPKGGIRVGVRAYEENLLRDIEKHPPKNPQKKRLRDLLKVSVEMTHSADNILKETRKIWESDTGEHQRIWLNYMQDLAAFALFQKRNGFSRRLLLKEAKTRGKEMT